MPAKRVHIVVAGRVQGVFFRASVVREARSVGAKGYVKNLPDGSVEAVVEGDIEAVDHVTEFCRTGPPSARVDRISVTDQDVTGSETDFVVRY